MNLLISEITKTTVTFGVFDQTQKMFRWGKSKEISSQKPSQKAAHQNINGLSQTNIYGVERI